MIKDFKDTVAVVTGAGNGIGRSLALAFAKREMKVVIADVNEQALNKVARELMATGAEVLSMVVDVSNREQVANLADTAYDRFGKVNILCNNAGVGTGAPTQMATSADWDWVLGVNQFGVIYGVSSFLPRMLKSGEPCHIVNTASVAGHVPGDQVQYCVSKFAVVAFSEALKLECFNTNVGVSVLSPGFVNTQIIKNAEDFRSERTDIFQPPDEMIEMYKPMMENARRYLSSGMPPDIVAEKVIIAIKEDILHVLSHPEYMPLIKSRYEYIHNDVMKLDGLYSEMTGQESKAVKNGSGLRTFRNEAPGFSIQYPENWIQLEVAPRMGNAVFYASQEPGRDLTIRVDDQRDPTQSTGDSLKTVTANLASMVRVLGTDINILSDQQTKLKDGTPAAEGLLEFRRAGMHKVKLLTLITTCEDKWITVVIGVIPDFYKEEFRDILYSLKFD